MKKILVVSLILMFSIISKADTEHKKIEKTFTTENVKEFVVENRDGKIEVEQWDKKEIEVKVDISVESKNPKKLKEILSQIDVDFVQKADYLSVKTKFEGNFNFKKLANKYFSGGSVNVRYKIFVPKDLILKITNSNGDVFLGDYIGDISLDVKDGDIKLGSSVGNSNITLFHGGLSVESLGKGNCVFESSNIDIKKADHLKIDAKGSDINIDEANNLSITTSRGNCTLGNIGTLRGASTWTDYEVKDVEEELVFDLWLGGMYVRNIHNMFSLVDIKTSRAKVGLTFMEGSAYDIEMRHHKNVKLDLPAGIKLVKRNSAEKNIFISEGNYGGVNKFKSKVKVNASGCRFYIQ